MIYLIKFLMCLFTAAFLGGSLNAADKQPAQAIAAVPAQFQENNSDVNEDEDSVDQDTDSDQDVIIMEEDEDSDQDDVNN